MANDVKNISRLDNENLVAALRNSWLCQFYRKRLKKYYSIRLLTQWFWRKPFLFFLRLLLLRKKSFPLIKLSDFVNEKRLTVYPLADATLVNTPVPSVFPAKDQPCLVAPHDSYLFPELFVTAIKNGVTYGNTNLIFADSKVIYHDLYDFSRDYTSEELHARILIHVNSQYSRGFFDNPVTATVSIAASFVDACASNYAHWLTEVLPRIAVFCADERFKNVPLVVNDDLHSNIMESLLLVAGAEREIITLQTGISLAVQELYLTSVAGYVPFDQRTTKLSGHSQGMFSPPAFQRLRNTLNTLVENTENKSGSEKIYLRRTSGIRKITNSNELEKLLTSYGYVMVEPEKLTFLQQVQLFKNAKQIIAPTGAALANAIFCTPGTQIGILMAKHPNMIYRYWYNMLAPLQIKVFHVLGNIIKNRDLGIHGDFSVNTTDFIDLLEALGEK